MSKAITLPSGATVTLRDPKSLRQKDRTKVYQAASNAEGIMQGVSMIDGLIAVLVESWSFDLIIPSVHLPSLGELEIPDYDALAEEGFAVAFNFILSKLNKSGHHFITRSASASI